MTLNVATHRRRRRKKAAGGPSALFRQRGRVAFDCEVAPDVRTVKADRDRLLQAIGNLLNNALKFTPDGGRMSLRAAEHEVLRKSVFTTPGLVTRLNTCLIFSTGSGEAIARHGTARDWGWRSVRVSSMLARGGS
jgi:hypothetical protein